MTSPLHVRPGRPLLCFSTIATRGRSLGTGCTKCTKLYEAAKGVEAGVAHVTDIKERMKRGVMVTPALAVDGQVKAADKVVTPGEMAKLLG